MLANFILCQSCGCKGKAGNTLSANRSEMPVFPYHGHDPFEGTMRYSCTNCRATLLVDPMDMLTVSCARGVPKGLGDKLAGGPLTGVILRTGGIIHKIPQKIPAGKYHL